MTDDDGLREELARTIRLARLARGWGSFLRLVERIRRQDAGEPLVRDRAA